jgi:predicted Zn-dependent protease
MTRLIARIVNGVVTDKGELDQFAVKYHSKRSCRRCHERGWQFFSTGDKVAEIRTCICVERSLARALKPSQELAYKVYRPHNVSKVYYSHTSKKHTEVVTPL